MKSFDMTMTQNGSNAPQNRNAEMAWCEQTFGSVESPTLPGRDVYEPLEETRGCHTQPLGIKGSTELDAAPFAAAFALTLRAFTGDDLVSYATLDGGRLLPVCHDFARLQTVSDLTAQTRALLSQLRQLQHVTFADVCQLCGMTDDVCFSFECEGQPGTAASCPVSKLGAQVTLVEGEYQLQLQYDAQEYSVAIVRQLAASYRHLLQQVIDRPETPLSSLTVCDDEQLKQLDRFNAMFRTPGAEYREESVIEAFREAARQYPDNVAARFRDLSYTYRELDALTDRIGAQIYSMVKDCGKAEPVVSILIPRSELMFILPLAVMKAGCAYQPLDPSYPQERLNFMVKDADAVLLIADPTLRSAVDEYEGNVLLTSQLADESSCTGELAPAVAPSQLLILLYTSGSTGVPKGVMLEHRQVMAYVRWYQHQYEMTPASVGAAYASFGFDADMMDLYTPLTLGATLCVIPDEIRLDLVALRDFMNRYGVTVAFMTTQVAQQFALNVEGLTTLRHLSMGGEKMMSMQPRTDFRLHNIYGPTECSIAVTQYEVNCYEPNIPIGHPTETTTLRVVDKAGHRLPVGAAGELWVNGPQVGRGYLRRPEKTAEVFIEHEGQRWYRTGDIVRYREDGNVEFVGRKDSQVKVRGFRIELKEVEAVIRDYKGIQDVTVQAFDDPNGGKFIAAYVVSDDTVDVEALNAFILDQKPPYMVPAVTIQIDRIPLNVNQKVDKKALPQPVAAAAAHPQESVPVRLNRLEQELHDIIATVVGANDFGLTNVLAYLGLTSITSLKLAAQLYKRFGIQVDSKALAKTASLQSLEDEIVEGLLNGNCPKQDAVAPDANTGSEAATATSNAANATTASSTASFAPLTYAQLGVYLDCLKHPGSIHYNLPAQMQLPASVTADEAVAAVRATVANHQSFRLVFSNAQGEPQQHLLYEQFADVEVLTLTPEERQQYIARFVQPFDLAKGPLYRFALLLTPATDAQPATTTLLMDIHHLIADGGSLDLVGQEIAARLNGEAPEAEAYPYLQFALDQKAAQGGKEYHEAHDFFDRQLSQCEGAIQIVPDMAKNPDASHTQGDVRSAVQMAPVEQLARQLGVSPMSICLAAAYYTVCRFAGTKQVYLGTISNGRSDLRTFSTTGMFVNTLALSSTIADQTVSQYIQQTARQFDETLTHEQYPFAQIAADYDFQPEVVFEYQVGILSGYDVRGTQVSVEALALQQTRFKLVLSVWDNAETGGHDVVVSYDASLYSSALAQSLAESMSAVIAHFTAQPDALVKAISIMSPGQQQVVDRMHTVATFDVPYKCFYEPIEHWATVTPDAPAVVACDRQLSFAEFNRECNRVAHALMARGVRQGDRVVLLLPRDSRVLCCIFGVSKAGAAYIPCDPAYPAERIALILDDSKAAYVITTADHMAEHGAKAILVDDLFASVSSDADFENPALPVSPDDLAYLIYTSGSTGRPKGVMLRHIGICSYLYDHPANVHIHGLIEEGVKAFLCITTLSFDMSLKEFAGALHNGITAVLANEAEVNNPMLLARLFRQTGAQCINGTPSRILNCMESAEFCEALSKCKCIWSGGEKYSDKLLQRLHEMGVRIFNTYGPTEVTVSSNIGELTHQTSVTVGRPLLNYTEFVVDCDGNELPAGVVGELYIGGPGVARGYNNLPVQTQARFVDYHGVRVYKSGDYARWLPDGQVDILGRLDNQVKLNGLRIELGEVESAISRFEGIGQVVVMIRNISGRDHLSAYFVADRSIDIEALKAQIGETLTHYMVPTAYLQMDHFPLTPNGKTDLKHLPEPQLAQLGGDYVAPRNKAEEDFCRIYQKILGLERVSAADSFFDLGGTSLTVTRVIVEAKVCGYDVAYADVFSHATAQQLARLVMSDGDAQPDADPEITDYDYSRIDQLLSRGTLDAFRQGERLTLGDVVLTGANGYLGIHLLHDLLEHHLVEHPECRVFCLVRHGRGGVSSEARLQDLLFYYFEQNYADRFGRQVVVIDGDVTNARAFDAIPVSQTHDLTVINCAAVVKHFSEGTEIEDINIGGLKTCVDFCLRTGARLIQTSTNSTGGMSVGGYPDPDYHYSEQTHYFGQSLTSKYTRSKFIAERMVFEAILDKGLVAKVMRLGNLAPRATDGEFQINFRSNSSMGRLHIYQMLRAASYTDTMDRMEFSPIDEVAHAVLLLATTPRQCVVFHPFNDHMVKLGDVIQEMAQTLGIRIDEVEDDTFEQKLQEAGQDPQKAEVLQSMLAYKAGGKERVTEFVKYNPYTIHVLARLGFHWNVTSWDYVSRFVQAIASLEFFNDKR